MPKPRQIQEIKEETRPPKESTLIESEKKSEKSDEKLPKEVEKTKEKEKSRNGAKETFASIFASKSSNFLFQFCFSSKLLVILVNVILLQLIEDTEETSNSKGTPVGITNPIKKETQESRIPREAVRRFDGKSREVRIPMTTKNCPKDLFRH